MSFQRIHLSIILLLSLSLVRVVGQNHFSLDSTYLKQTQKLLIKTPCGLAPNIYSRAIWGSVAKSNFGRNVLLKANTLINKKFPAWNDSVYLSFYKTGIRKDADNMMAERASWLPTLVEAECIENKGRFISKIESILLDLCHQPTWCLAAHDTHMDNYKGNFGVDLSAANYANQMAQTLFMLGNNISVETSEKVKSELNKRIFMPVINSLKKPNGQHWWMNGVNNWTAVCWAGVTASALAVETDMNKRTTIAAMAEQYINGFLNGFLDDGYCVEGVGYFSYGFGNFLLLRETLCKNSNGKIDLLDNPKVAKILQYPQKSEIINGIYPATTDCRVGTQPSPWIAQYCQFNGRKQLNNLKIDNSDMLSDLLSLFGTPAKYTTSKAIGYTLSSYMPEATLFIARPKENEKNDKMAIAIMGGCNGYSHNHNDLGTYTIVVGNEVMMGDMGGPTAYTAKTFSKERYSLYKSFSSIGHPVPLVNGVEQHESLDAKGITIDTLFSEKQDRIAYDIKSGYNIPELKSLIRIMDYYRGEETSVVIKDVFEATTPIDFETAITTRSIVNVENNKIYLISSDKKIEVTVESSTPITITQSVIADYAMVPFKRIAININEKCKSGWIKLIYRTVS